MKSNAIKKKEIQEIERVKTIEEVNEKSKSGIYIPSPEEVAKVLGVENIKSRFYVKEGGEGVYIVVDQFGGEARVYKKADGVPNPKECAESYAKKLNN